MCHLLRQKTKRMRTRVGDLLAPKHLGVEGQGKSPDRGVECVGVF